MCGRGACKSANDDAEEQIIALKFELFHSRQYVEETSKRMVMRKDGLVQTRKAIK